MGLIFTRENVTVKVETAYDSEVRRRVEGYLKDLKDNRKKITLITNSDSLHSELVRYGELQKLTFKGRCLSFKTTDFDDKGRYNNKISITKYNIHHMGSSQSTGNTMADPEVKRKIDDLIKSKKVVVISKTYCPYCKKAKSALENYNLSNSDYYVWEIENEPNVSEIQNYLKSLTGASTVPRVFINGNCIGGGDDTYALHKNGKLATMLS
ncbi:hypothetical protein RDWZM_010395 [Blomia tropicalis]|uniref:Glutaredoxin domain-containing protein n=1 Tax=Blomia tropicalis TaxID=40697 RepID=A0A9Q0LYE2_BLOTA|nr:hypothetical protein RDWZM_010395 [Blomia tropicalis]